MLRIAATVLSISSNSVVALAVVIIAIVIFAAIVPILIICSRIIITIFLLQLLEVVESGNDDVERGRQRTFIYCIK